jgi:hypothetical protein
VDVPGQQFLDAVDGVVGDAGQHLTQIGFGIETVEFRRTNQTVDRRRPLPARIIEELPVADSDVRFTSKVIVRAARSTRIVHSRRLHPQASVRMKMRVRVRQSFTSENHPCGGPQVVHGRSMGSVFLK